MSGGWLLSWSLFGVSVGCQLVGVLLSSRCRFSVLMLSGGAAHALRLVAHLVGVLLLMSGGWLLSWSLFGVSVGCQLVGVLLSSRCRFSVLMLSGVLLMLSDWLRILSGCLLLLMVSPDVAPISAAVPVAHALRLVADWLRILSGCRLLMLSRCREGVAVILSGSVAVALRCQSVGCRDGAPHPQISYRSPTVGRRPTQQCGGGLLRG